MDIVQNMFVDLFERVKYMESGHQLKFTQAERTTLKLTFNEWVSGGQAAQGFEMFLKMFQNHPETQKLFEFARGNSAAQLQNSSRMLFHVTRVVKHIGLVVNNLERPENVVATIKQIGGRHTCFGVPPNYFPHLGVAMRQVMSQKLKNWTPQLDAIWTRVYNWIAEQLVAGEKEYGKTH